MNVPRRAHGDLSGERSLHRRSAPTGGAPAASAWRRQGAHVLPLSLSEHEVVRGGVFHQRIPARARTARPLTEHVQKTAVFSGVERPGRARAGTR